VVQSLGVAAPQAGTLPAIAPGAGPATAEALNRLSPAAGPDSQDAGQGAGECLRATGPELADSVLGGFSYGNPRPELDDLENCRRVLQRPPGP
jgi:hypothetical protein